MVPRFGTGRVAAAEKGPTGAAARLASRDEVGSTGRKPVSAPKEQALDRARAPALDWLPAFGHDRCLLVYGRPGTPLRTRPWSCPMAGYPATGERSVSRRGSRGGWGSCPSSAGRRRSACRSARRPARSAFDLASSASSPCEDGTGCAVPYPVCSLLFGICLPIMSGDLGGLCAYDGTCAEGDYTASSWPSSLPEPQARVCQLRTQTHLRGAGHGE
jgi:hypothetical protein